jgi:flavodoxin
MSNPPELQPTEKQLMDLQEEKNYGPVGYLQYWPALVATLIIVTAIMGLNTEPGLNWLPSVPLFLSGLLLLLAVITVPRFKQPKELTWERRERELKEKQTREKALSTHLQEALPSSVEEIPEATEPVAPEAVVLEAICPVKASEVDVLVLWGSETGNAEGLAELTASQLSASGLKAKAVDMATVTLPALPDFSRILVLTSTWGDGEPPSNATRLWESFQQVDANMSKTRFSVLSLGDTSYPEFCKCGKDFDQFLAAKGAQRVYPRVDCDLDYQAAFDGWLSGVKSALT